MSSSDEESGWDDLVNTEKQPEDSAFLVSRMSDVPTNVVKTQMDTPRYDSIPKTPGLTKGDDKRLLNAQRKVETSPNYLFNVITMY